MEDSWRGFKGGTPPGFWTTTASVLLQVIEIKGDAKDTPVDQGVDHVDHPWHKDAGGPGTLVFIVGCGSAAIGPVGHVAIKSMWRNELVSGPSKGHAAM